MVLGTGSAEINVTLKVHSQASVFKEHLHGVDKPMNKKTTTQGCCRCYGCPEVALYPTERRLLGEGDACAES